MKRRSGPLISRSGFAVLSSSVFLSGVNTIVSPLLLTWTPSTERNWLKLISLGEVNGSVFSFQPVTQVADSLVTKITKL